MKKIVLILLLICAKIAFATSCIPEVAGYPGIYERSPNVFVAKVIQGSKDPSPSQTREAYSNNLGYPVKVELVKILKGTVPAKDFFVYDIVNLPYFLQNGSVYTFLTNDSWRVSLCSVRSASL
jgi:hypothetical protein